MRLTPEPNPNKDTTAVYLNQNQETLHNTIFKPEPKHHPVKASQSNQTIFSAHKTPKNSNKITFF